jgi:hypothetical protein
MKKKRIKFSEGGDIPDIPREPLRDSSGRRVRSGMDTFTKRFAYNRSIDTPDEDEELEGSDVMSGSTEARQGKKFPETRIESGPKGYLDDDIKAPSEKDDNDIRQRPRPRPPGPRPVKNVDIDESDRRREERENAKKTQDVDESDRRREEVSSLSQKAKPKPAKKKEEASKPPAGAFRGTRSEGGNYKPSVVPDESKAPSAGGFTKKSPKRESMFSSGNTKLRDITEGRMTRFAKGGSVGSASKRADGIAMRGKTRGKIC